jgi:choline dehydrogenase
MFADAFQWHIPHPMQGEYITVIVDLLRPLSRNGEIKLRSTDPLEQPYINLNYFSNDLDLVALREGVRFVHDILLNGEGFKDIIGEAYPYPLPLQSDEAMETAILERCQTGYRQLPSLPHASRFPQCRTDCSFPDPCGSCRLSKTVEQGVVDPKLAVHGTKNLRVIDASIFPVIPDCRIQNAVYMVAEKVGDADGIREKYPSLTMGSQGADIIKAAYPELY